MQNDWFLYTGIVVLWTVDLYPTDGTSTPIPIIHAPCVLYNDALI